MPQTRAVVTDLKSDTETLIPIGPIPSKLVVFCSPYGLPADNKAYNAIQVQLRDAQGNPAKDPDGDVTVSPFSSDPTVGAITSTISYLQSHAEIAIALASVLVVLAPTWTILRYLDTFYRFLGKTDATVIALVMALFLGAVAVQ